MKTVYRAASAATLAVLMTACAGGGGISAPATAGIFNYPVQKAAEASEHTNPHYHTAPLQSFQSNSSLGRVVVRGNVGGYSKEDNYYYQAADGKLYQLRSSNQIMEPTQAPTKTALPNPVVMQPTDNGGKLVHCCERSAQEYGNVGALSGLSGKATGGVRYGAWVSPSGAADMFVAGVAAQADKLLGAEQNIREPGRPTGKITYEVLAMRMQGTNPVVSQATVCHFCSASHDRSYITVNFNTDKVGGTIVGNTAFGADIEFTDVNLNASSRDKFSGLVTSGGVSGQVEGALFGEKQTSGWGTYHSGEYIGGKVVFSGNEHLNAVFGGSSGRGNALYNRDSTSTDTTRCDTWSC